jgi:hypothetical protein
MQRCNVLSSLPRCFTRSCQLCWKHPFVSAFVQSGTGAGAHCGGLI